MERGGAVLLPHETGYGGRAPRGWIISKLNVLQNFNNKDPEKLPYLGLQ